LLTENFGTGQQDSYAFRRISENRERGEDRRIIKTIVLETNNERKIKLMKTRLKIFTTVLSVLACCAFLPTMQAQLPPEIPGNPDGCYPAFTTAEGCNALHQLFGGIGNTAVGWYANFLAGDASFNTSVGAGTLALDSGIGSGANTAVGTAAMILNLSGDNNTAVGVNALVFNSVASHNTAVGSFAMYNNDSSGAGSAVFNTAVGDGALEANIDGGGNTAVGIGSLANNTVSLNTAVGVDALFSNFDGTGNTGVGSLALAANVSGLENVAVGFGAAASTTGGFSVAVGFNALNAATGGQNTAVGDNALVGVTSGVLNTSLGDLAGSLYTGAESANVCIGAFVGGVAGESNTVRIADNLPTGVGLSQCFIGGILSHFTPLAFGNPLVTIDPVTQQLGWTMDFSANKVAEQQKKIEEQQASISQLKSEMQTMVAQLKEQAEQIQKVSAQLEVSKPAPQVVTNKP
jgi:hypothetical protein